MAFTLSDIAEALGASICGKGDIEITAVAEPGEAGPTDIVLAIDQKYAEALREGGARVAILWDGADWQDLGLEGAILMPHAGAAMVGLTRIMAPPLDIAAGIHPSAIIDASASIGDGAAIAPLVVIGANVIIGKNACIGPHVSIGAGVTIGDNAVIHAGVRLMAATKIGANFICQPNAVIGGDGFSFKTIASKSAVQALRENVGASGGTAGEVQGSSHWGRVYSLGNVVIGDDVEVGANSTIDRGTIRATRIGRGTKIDNQVQVGHNCEIGEDCLICGACGISGSTRIGDRVVLGGQVGVSDNITIGDDVIAGGRTSIYSNVPPKRAIWGTPAVRLETQMAIQKETRRLPRLAQRLRDLEKIVAASREPDSE